MYTIAESNDPYDDMAGKHLEGPGDWECWLGEPEDCTWSRDGNDAMVRLNELAALLDKLVYFHKGKAIVNAEVTGDGEIEVDLTPDEEQLLRDHCPY